MPKRTAEREQWVRDIQAAHHEYACDHRDLGPVPPRPMRPQWQTTAQILERTKSHRRSHSSAHPDLLDAVRGYHRQHGISTLRRQRHARSRRSLFHPNPARYDSSALATPGDVRWSVSSSTARRDHATPVYDAWRSYRYAVAATDRELGNTANALAEQTAWTLQAVDLLLLDTAQWYRSERQAIPPDNRLDAAFSMIMCGRERAAGCAAS